MNNYLLRVPNSVNTKTNSEVKADSRKMSPDLPIFDPSSDDSLKAHNQY
jgi:hypothetical protein